MKSRLGRFAPYLLIVLAVAAAVYAIRKRQSDLAMVLGSGRSSASYASWQLPKRPMTGASFGAVFTRGLVRS